MGVLCLCALADRLSFVVVLKTAGARLQLEDPGGEVGEGPDQVRLPQPDQHQQQAMGEEPGRYPDMLVGTAPMSGRRCVLVAVGDRIELSEAAVFPCTLTNPILFRWFAYSTIVMALRPVLLGYCVSSILDL